MTTTSDADLLDALRAADPAAAVVLASADATAAVRRARPSRRPRRRAATWAIAIGAIVTVGVAGAAVANGFVARTGWFGSPGPGGSIEDSASTESDGTEWLDLAADDLRDVVASLYPEWVPLAPGTTRDGLTARVTATMSSMEGLVQETSVLRTYEFEAYRDWIGAWIAAHRAGDAAGQAAAADVLQDAADWPATAATDGGGIADGMRAFARLIAGGDGKAAQALAQLEGSAAWDGDDRSDLIAEIAGAQGVRK